MFLEPLRHLPIIFLDSNVEITHQNKIRFTVDLNLNMNLSDRSPIAGLTYHQVRNTIAILEIIIR